MAKIKNEEEQKFIHTGILDAETLEIEVDGKKVNLKDKFKDYDGKFVVVSCKYTKEL